MKRARRLGMPAVSESFADFSGGIITGVSEAARGFTYLKAADNIIFDPKRALASRPGYRAVSDSVLGFPPTSLMRWYGVGTTETFVAASTKIYKIVAGGAYVLQSLPITPGTGKWSHTNLNGLLICAQEGSADPPLIYDGTAWMSSTFPTPANSFTAAEGTAGLVDVGIHFWRIRWRFKNGASLACAQKQLEILTSVKKAELTVIPLSARSDYIGFSVERTKVGEPGLWYWVGDSASKTAVIFTDNTADADLGDLIAAEPGPYGAAPHFEGVIAHVDRLFGWSGTNLYVSRGIGEEDGSGVLNFNPLQMYPIKADDGDPIMTAVPQVDRLVILKRMSLHAFLGYDPESFARVQIDDSVGAASTRGAASASGLVFFYGGHNRLFVISGNAVRGFGDTEMGEYLRTILQNQDDLVQVYNYRGESILFCYPKAAATYCDEIVAYSLADRNWQHHTNIRVAAALCPKVDAEFGGATMLFADPKSIGTVPGPEIVVEEDVNDLIEWDRGYSVIDTVTIPPGTYSLSQFGVAATALLEALRPYTKCGFGFLIQAGVNDTLLVQQGGVDYRPVLSPGQYTGVSYAVEVQSKIQIETGHWWSVVYNASTHKLEFESDAQFHFLGEGSQGNVEAGFFQGVNSSSTGSPPCTLTASYMRQPYAFWFQNDSLGGRWLYPDRPDSVLPTCGMGTDPLAMGGEPNYSEPLTDIPEGAFHVWSAFVGELDQANYAGTEGDPIACYFESPFWDGGGPDTVKDFDRIQFHTKEGNATFVLTIETEDYGTTIGLSVSQSGSTWGGAGHKATTLVWNQGKWGGRKASHATTGITAGTIGHRARVKGRCSATEKFVLEGWDLDALLLPERNY